MRLKLDENLPAELVNLFGEAGHDAVTVFDQRLGGASDPEIASACAREGRAIVTLDTDFADIRTYPPRAYSGIVVFRLNNQSRDQILQVAARLVQALPADLRGLLWIVEESRVRIRD